MAPKRKLASSGLQRRVRPRKEEKWEPELEPEQTDSDSDVSEEEVHTTKKKKDVVDSEEESGSEGDSGSDDEPPLPKADISSISFGALARAQASMPASERRNKKQKKTEEPEDEDPWESRRQAKKAEIEKAKRTSKHAPQEQSSKRPVSRRREVVSVENKRVARDPRFDPVIGGARLNEARTKKAYAFLDEYREKELAELRVQAKKAKDPEVKEDLKRQIMSMESKKKAQKKKDEEEALLAEHRKKEKEMVAQGKQPFYLKKSEQKKQLLINRYAGMTKGQVDKAIERKRKKVAGKEKKELYSLQRVTDRNERY
ncbi:unnamed protein product [Clonostachys rosea]|uniref:rRNA biogenesis protein RRP36 n=1 Tax=Bionectria ochroleuca TaxID=29856 RepID=A0ABY6UY62_BIOOC|nr:unnamed protein product [Clonostachys rosea]